MGWSFTHRPAGIDSRKWAEDNLAGDLWNIVDFEAKRDAYYFVADKNDDSGLRVLFVIGVQRVPRSEYNFGWKSCDEGMGPIWTTCPDRLLDLMGDAPNEWASDWRDRCRAYNARPKVVKGARVRFAHPISFTNGAEIANFTYEGRNTFAETDGYGRYSISGWKERKYEVVA